MSGPARRLVVLRHAKSAWPEGIPDHDRPLGPRGLRDAPAAGRALTVPGLGLPDLSLPDLALCSTAVRARRTWELAAAEWAVPPPVRFERRIYEASPARLLEVVRETPSEVRTLLLIGHSPGLEGLITGLAGEAAGDTLERVRAKFPTSALAVLDWAGPDWTALAPGAARLTSVTVPRGEKA
ncbi:histidine phosphatase family protein [Streptomyces sp. NPDC047024]|uniref:SixA phosphatase family protein n=1 Tax=Streptomyces sp. NPDC047024 TaxID=3155476 RepID=UPI0033DA662B